MERFNCAILLDETGESVLTCNKEKEMITFIVSERYVQGTFFPEKKIQIVGKKSLEQIRDFINGVIN